MTRVIYVLGLEPQWVGIIRIILKIFTFVLAQFYLYGEGRYRKMGQNVRSIKCTIAYFGWMIISICIK